VADFSLKIKIADPKYQNQQSSNNHEEEDLSSFFLLLFTSSITDPIRPSSYHPYFIVDYPVMGSAFQVETAN
jgi:hypothetical protein